MILQRICETLIIYLEITLDFSMKSCSETRQNMKSDQFGCQRLHEIARGALKAVHFILVNESEGERRRVGKLLERR